MGDEDTKEVRKFDPKEKARTLAWGTYLDLLTDPKVDAKVRREAAKDVLEATGDLVKQTPAAQTNQLVVNVQPEHLTKALGAVKGMLGGGGEE